MRDKINWVEMSSCGQGDNVPEQVSTQLHVADRGEAGGQGCPSGQFRSANSNPWDGEILHFPTKALEIEVFSHSRCSPVHPGRDEGLWAVSRTPQEFPLLSTHGDKSGTFCPVWGPRCKREDEKAEVVPRLLSSAG